MQKIETEHARGDTTIDSCPAAEDNADRTVSLNMRINASEPPLQTPFSCVASARGGAEQQKRRLLFVARPNAKTNAT